MNRSLLALLIVSLGLNIFIGGFWAGRMIGGAHQQENIEDHPSARNERVRRGGLRLGAIGVARDDIPRELRGALRQSMRETRAERLRDREEMWDLRGQLHDALIQDPVDRAAAQELLQSLNALNRKREERAALMMLEFLEGLPAEERRAVLERGAQRLEGRSRRRRSAPRDVETPGEKTTPIEGQTPPE